MSDNNPNVTLLVAQNLLGHLAEPMNSELKDLLGRAEKGMPITRDINNLLYKHDNIRLWMDEQTSIQSGTRGSDSYLGLAGNSNLITASKKWVCPKNPRDHWILVIQEGEDPPTCKEHKIEMIYERNKKG